jgi:ribonuclease J
MTKNKIRIIPLGGLGEIGRNMMAIECGDDLMVVDAGLMFPEEDMPGVDFVIPDIAYILEHQDKLRGIVVTHGHEDHTGALPYILSRVPATIYATALTQALISLKLREHRCSDKAQQVTVESHGRFKLGCFEVEFFPVCHSIPDSVGLVIRTPAGVLVHSGDFKLDYTPVGGPPTDLTRLAQVGAEGVLLLMADSTYVELPGYTPSETTVGETLERIIGQAPGRVIVTTFSSLLSRVQQVLDIAARQGRKVFIVGRSMRETSRIAAELGYLRVPAGILLNMPDLNGMPGEKVILLTTGSQGEPTSALVRIANKDNSQVRIIPGDTVIMSATPVPGNEALVNRTIDNLFRQGAHVIYERITPVHVHGHGSQEELKVMLNLVKPKYFMPVHGEYRHLSLHARLARNMGLPAENVFVCEDGDILDLDQDGGRKVGKVPAGYVYVDGVLMGDLANVVLRDRRALSRDGIVVAIVPVDKESGRLAGKPDIVARGFLEAAGEKQVLEGARELLAVDIGKNGASLLEASMVNSIVRDVLGRYFYEQTRRRPMVVAVALEV